MIETGENVRNFRSKMKKLFGRSDRKVDVDGRNKIDEAVAAVTVQGQEIAAKFRSKNCYNFFIKVCPGTDPVLHPLLFGWLWIRLKRSGSGSGPSIQVMPLGI